MPDTQSNALSMVETMYQEYGKRAKELANAGTKLIGYVCSLVPLEMITAAGCIPFRVRGDVNEPITKGDTLLETIVCPFYRSCFDLMAKNKYDFLSGMVIPHACDSMTRSYDVWNYSLNLPFFHFINTPSVCTESSSSFFEAELNTFRKTLEDYTNAQITDQGLTKAIQAYNQNRKKVRAIYDLRKTNPPSISGVDLVKVLTVGSSLPVTESTQLFERVLNELSGHNRVSGKKSPRILIDGPCLDNIDLIKLVEDSGANVVADTTCNGTRDHFPLANEADNPIRSLSHRYLDQINCPKTYRENRSGSFQADAENRFGDMRAFIQDYDVDGVILYVYKYCDPFGFEVPARKAYLESMNIPVLYLEDLYSAGAVGQLRTRVQAFLEMIG